MSPGNRHAVQIVKALAFVDADQLPEGIAWPAFRDNPADWLRRASEADADAVLTVVNRHLARDYDIRRQFDGRWGYVLPGGVAIFGRYKSEGEAWERAARDAVNAGLAR